MSKYIALDPIFISLNCLSIISCVIVFFGIVFTQKPLTTALKLILLLTVSDFGISCMSLSGHFIGVNYDSCQYIGLFAAFFGWTSVFWCSCLSLLAYLTMGGFAKYNIVNLFRTVIAGCVIFSLINVLLPIFNVTGLEYKDVDGSCRTAYQTEGMTLSRVLMLIFMRVFGYGLALVMTAIAYIRAYRLLRSVPDGMIEAYQIDSKKLLLYPLAQLIVYLPNISYIFIAMSRGMKEPWITLIAYWASLPGFVNSLVYGLQFMAIRQSKKIDYETQGSELHTNSFIRARLGFNDSTNLGNDSAMNLEVDISSDTLQRNRRESSLSGTSELKGALRIG